MTEPLVPEPIKSVAPEPSLWQRQVEADPGHSDRYVERFRSLEKSGFDIVGEARLIDAMLPRGARVLDAGCGPGRLGGYLHRVGHTVVGVDVDPVLIAAAEQDYPGPRWLVGDLSQLDLTALTPPQEPFDAIVCAGNVVTFVAPSTRQQVLERLAAHLADDGRLVIGFGAGRDYVFEEFFGHAAAAGLTRQHTFSTWDLRPFDADSHFVVAVFVRS